MSATLVVERIEGLCLVGWAADRAQRQPLPVTLHIDGTHVELPFPREERQDVADSLGAPNAAFGFRIPLPPQVWQPGGQALRSLVLTAGSAQHTVADTRPLEAHAQSILLLPPGPARTASAARALAHQAAAQPQPPWPAALLDALSRAAHPVRAHIEACTQGVALGWALAQGQPGEERLTLHTATGQDIQAPGIRTPRSDVQSALDVARTHLGFELEIPPTVWRHADAQGHVSLRLHVNGEPSDAALTLNPHDLVVDLHALHAQHTAPGAAEDTYALLHLLAHANAAALWPRLTAPLRNWLRAQATRYGLADTLPHDGGALTAPTDERDAATQALHHALAALNARLTAGDDADTRLAAILDALAATEPASALRHDLSLAVLPSVCALDRYPALRPWLDAARLRELAHADDAWALSLTLPEAIAAGDFDRAASATTRLPGAPGWLNTACLAAALRLLAAQWPTAPAAQTAAGRWLDALSALLAHEGSSYWQRGHDLQLIAAHVTLLGLTTRLPAAQAQALTAAAVRTHGLVPAFWAELHRQWPPALPWPDALTTAHADWQQAHADWLAGDGEATALANLALRTDWPDAAIWARMHLARSAAALTPDAAATAARLASAWDPAEPLRLLAHPAADPALAAQLDGPLGGLRARVRTASGLTHARHEATIGRWLGALAQDAALAQAPPASTLRALAASGDDGAMAALLATWLALRNPADPQALGRAHELWHAAWAQRVDAATAHPPQPLVAAAMALARAANPAARALGAEWSQRLAQQAPARWALAQPPAAPVIACPDPLHRTLVVVYACRAHLTTRVARIRATWGQRLTERGVPWLVVVGQGQGQLDGDVLALPVSDAYEALPQKTLALLDWALRRTDCDHLLKIDDDCHLNVDAWLATQPHLPHHHHGRRIAHASGGTQRRWHQARADSEVARVSVDKSPEPSTYADGGSGWSVSRWAMAALAELLSTARGARLTRGAYMEDKLLGDLLAAAGVPLAEEGWAVSIRRRFGGPEAVPVGAYQHLFDPGPLTTTLLTHLDDADALPAIERQARHQTLLTPPQLWPCDGPPRLAGTAHGNPLTLLSPAARVAACAGPSPLVVAVMRNEAVLLPHFLAHYRRLGVRHFVLVDNLSDDGTRELALAQPDVLLYAAHTPYRHSHYGVAWQQAVLAAHGHGRWAVLADLDEFLVYPDCETRPLTDWLAEREAEGADAVRTLLIDMYPEGALETADFSRTPPFEAAPCFDRQPLLPWHLGSGRYSNGQTLLSALRHRLAPGSAPNFFTAQKVAVLRHQPWLRLSEGLHDVAGARLAAGAACLAHFKYHAGFGRKVQQEVQRAQHFNGAQEYRRYLAMLAEAPPRFFDAARSTHFTHSADWAAWMSAGDNPAHTP